MKSISNCQREFVSKCIQSDKRLDGRKLTEGRKPEIVFGEERGCCMVIQGNTRALVRVSAEVTKPRVSAPSEGTILVYFHLSPMASPDLHSCSRYSDEFIVPQRCLERCLRESKCIDLESLCIKSGLNAWTIKVDIHGLNDDGSLVECASVAAIAALAHFRRPAITLVGDQFIVHPLDEKNPVALNLHHMPLCICLALFEKSKYIAVDPTEIEEKVSEGCYVMGVNAHQEICFVKRRGAFTIDEDALCKVEDVAIQHAQEVTQVIRSALDDDAYKRATNEPIGFSHLIKTGAILGARHLKVTDINFADLKSDTPKESADVSSVEIEEISVVRPSKSAVTETMNLASEVRPSTSSVTEIVTLDSEVRPSTSSVTEIVTLDSDEEAPEVRPNITAVTEVLNLESDEEEIVYLGTKKVEEKVSDKRGWFCKDPFA